MANSSSVVLYSAPAVYMSSTEASHLVRVRTVCGIRQVQLGDRVDCLLAWVDPGISVESPSLRLLNLQVVVLASRLKELPLVPIREWPVPVHVDQLLVPTNGRSSFSSEESSQIGWAELFPTFKEAERAAAGFR